MEILYDPNDAYLAVDPSVSGTAAAYCFNGDYKTRKFPSSKQGKSVADRIDRAQYSADAVGNWVGDRPSIPVVIFLEGYGFASQSGIWLGEHGGLMRKGLLAFTRRVFEIPPKSLKLFTTGTAKADKAQMGDAVHNIYGIRLPPTHDEVDAYALLRMGLILIGADEPQTEHQAACLSRHRHFVSNLEGFEQWQKPNRRPRKRQSRKKQKQKRLL